MPTSKDSLGFTLDPAWPWSISGFGLSAFLIVACVLVGLTIWTYAGVRGARKLRVLALICLRLIALLLACITVLRPSVAFQDEQHEPSTLLIVVDCSESMTIQDQHGSQSRWEYLRRLLVDSEPFLQTLREEHNVTVILTRFAGEVSDYDPEGKADGKRTDFGEMLHTLYERHGSDRNLRNLVILSDGADNGARYPALPLAARWRSLPCPLETFAFGQTTTTSQQRDIALTAINPIPSPVGIKGQLKVKGLVDATGFANPTTVNVRLLVNGEEVAMEKKTLTRQIGNEVTLTCDAPAQPGEIRVTLKIDPLAGELTQANNEISTYVTVTKEGISVLYVEGKIRAFEPKFIRYALSEEPSIRLFESVRLTDEYAPEEADVFKFEKQHYDVIIIGDITAKRLSANNPTILKSLYDQVVKRGSGLMMIGGYESFGNSDWDNTVLADLLPVRLNVHGQVDDKVQMVPTRDGLRHYVLRLADNEADNAAVWTKLRKLDGMTKLGDPKLQALVLAKSATGEPILVSEPHGAGRTLAFAGDTTWRWRTSAEGVRAHNRFWRQMVFWLAKRDEADGNVIILPDTRRLPAGGKQGFVVKLRGKGGVDIPEKDAQFDVSIIGPDQVESKVGISFERGEARGKFWKTDVPGEYQIVARGTGRDTDGKPLENLAPAKVRFVVYQDEAEMARQAADHDFLAKLANAGGGKFHLAEDLKVFLKELASQPLPQSKPKAKLWPDWRRSPHSQSASDQAAALASSGILACFLLFVMLLCLEWFLRRYWGLV